MKHNNIWLAATLILGGCGAMEQAPLVYSSTKQLGLGVKAGAPETPGVDVNIGFRAIDIAYVPIAVAKQCSKADGCSSDYNLQRVEGHSDQNGRSRVDRNRMSELRSIISEGMEANAQRSRRLVEIKSQLAEFANLSKTQSSIAALESAPAGVARVLTPTEVEQLATLKATETRVRNLPVQALNAELGTIEGQMANTAGRIDKAESELRILIAQKEEESGDTKTDALSVFGTFNGDTSGGTEGGGMKLGNTFSTGIAAQFIAQGIREAAPTKAIQDCIAVGKAAIDGGKIPQGQEAEVLKAIAKACETKERKDP